MKKIILVMFAFAMTAGQLSAQKSKKPKEVLIELTTTEGVLLIKLYNETPQHRDNMMKLVNEGYYDGLLFHRIIKDFMVQGGDPNSKGSQAGQALGQGGPGYTIPAELVDSLIHKKGALAAARLGDQANPQKASSGSQFYIVHGRRFNEGELKGIAQRSGIKYSQEQIDTYGTLGGTPHLDGGYTVFGEVVTGFDVLDTIATARTAPGDRPVTDIVILKAKVLD